MVPLIRPVLFAILDFILRFQAAFLIVGVIISLQAIQMFAIHAFQTAVLALAALYAKPVIQAIIYQVTPLNVWTPVHPLFTCRVRPQTASLVQLTATPAQMEFALFALLLIFFPKAPASVHRVLMEPTPMAVSVSRAIQDALSALALKLARHVQQTTQSRFKISATSIAETPAILMLEFI